MKDENKVLAEIMFDKDTIYKVEDNFWYVVELDDGNKLTGIVNDFDGFKPVNGVLMYNDWSGYLIAGFEYDGEYFISMHRSRNPRHEDTPRKRIKDKNGKMIEGFKTLFKSKCDKDFYNKLMGDNDRSFVEIREMSKGKVFVKNQYWGFIIDASENKLLHVNLLDRFLISGGYIYYKEYNKEKCRIDTYNYNIRSKR